MKYAMALLVVGSVAGVVGCKDAPAKVTAQEQLSASQRCNKDNPEYSEAECRDMNPGTLAPQPTPTPPKAVAPKSNVAK